MKWSRESEEAHLRSCSTWSHFHRSSCCNDRPWSETKEYVCMIFTTNLGINAVLVLFSKSDKSDDLKRVEDENVNKRVCLTEECAKAAGDILHAMDRSVDPCDDFYQFSCGNWIRTNPIPETSSSWNQFNLLREQLSRKVKRKKTKIEHTNPCNLLTHFSWIDRI
jgi:hypothetical protein